MCIQGLVRRPEGKRPLRRHRPACGSIVLKWIIKKWDREAWTGFIWLRVGTEDGCLQIWSLTLGSIKCREFLD
jgi:hypothetical protein